MKTLRNIKMKFLKLNKLNEDFFDDVEIDNDSEVNDDNEQYDENDKILYLKEKIYSHNLVK